MRGQQGVGSRYNCQSVANITHVTDVGRRTRCEIIKAGSPIGPILLADSMHVGLYPVCTENRAAGLLRQIACHGSAAANIFNSLCASGCFAFILLNNQGALHLFDEGLEAVLVTFPLYIYAMYNMSAGIVFFSYHAIRLTPFVLSHSMPNSKITQKQLQLSELLSEMSLHLVFPLVTFYFCRHKRSFHKITFPM